MINAAGTIFLDRDGVLSIPSEINGKGYAPRRFADLRLYDDAIQATQLLYEAGWKLVVVTNQPDIGAGLVDFDEVERMHDFLMKQLPLASIYTCPHTQIEACECRKPLSGLMRKAIDDGIVRASEPMWMVGDRDSDVDAGRRMGCRTVFINRNWDNETGIQAEFKVGSLEEAAKAIINS